MLPRNVLYVADRLFYKNITHKIGELLITDTAMSPLEALRVEVVTISVDITEADGSEHLHRGRLLKKIYYSLKTGPWL